WNTLGTDSTKEFTVFTDIGDRVLVGTRGDGYYEITDTSTIQDPSSEVADQTNYAATELYYGDILSMYYTTSSGSGEIFAGTAGSGLWKNTDAAWGWE
ncbi:MAG: hypothetical protein K9L68_12350, partial [Spirochaetales bacterium]|nr:hypothetical protein [Spirochaetales bacterium]MCF7939383.1 hypothetical protein [Spirochaetales bacterium]